MRTKRVHDRFELPPFLDLGQVARMLEDHRRPSSQHPLRCVSDFDRQNAIVPAPYHLNGHLKLDWRFDQVRRCGPAKLYAHPKLANELLSSIEWDVRQFEHVIGDRRRVVNNRPHEDSRPEGSSSNCKLAEDWERH